VRAKVWGCDIKDDLKEYVYDKEPESQLKMLLPTFSPNDSENIDGGPRRQVEDNET